MSPIRIALLAPAAAALLLLAACGKKEAPRAADATVPRVKTQVVQAGGETRRRSLVGEVQPADVWNLAFPIAGRVTQIAVTEGDRVKKGQLLAQLDPLVYELKLKNAQAELHSSTSDREEKKEALASRAKLRDQGFMAAGMLDKYRVDYTVAEQKVSNSESMLALAKRDLANTRLVAPADGVVSGRQIEPFADVNAGQTVMRLDGAGGLRVAIRVPERLLEDVAVGTTTAVEIGDRKFEGKVNRIDARAGAGDSFPVYVALNGPTDGIRPGVTARVDFAVRSATATADRNIRVPLAAVLPGDSPGHGYMFVLQANGTKVKRVGVRIQAVNENDAEVAQGLAAGDEIVTAGVAFLSDGQAVKRMQTGPMAQNR